MLAEVETRTPDGSLYVPKMGRVSGRLEPRTQRWCMTSTPGLKGNCRNFQDVVGLMMSIKDVVKHML